MGYRGSGKSTIGALVARRLKWKFVDLDELIEQRAGRTIAQIFKSEGEPAFRQLEKESLESIRRQKNQVIALGGGAVSNPEIRVMVKRMGKAVWLQVPPAILHARLQRDVKAGIVRPDLTSTGGLTEVETMLAQREPAYQAAANHILDAATDPPEYLAESIELWFRANDADAEADDPSRPRR
jgi:shikimate kinase